MCFLVLFKVFFALLKGLLEIMFDFCLGFLSKSKRNSGFFCMCVCVFEGGREKVLLFCFFYGFLLVILVFLRNFLASFFLLRDL